VEWRLFIEPKMHDATFYEARDGADHVNEAWAALRLYLAAAFAAYYAKFTGRRVIGDFGCGNGGCLDILCKMVGLGVRLFGHDLCPANVQWAHAKGHDVTLRDITKADLEWPDILILTETLEHLVDPHGFLARVPAATLLIATVPANENEEHHDTTHLWAWDAEGFERLLEGAKFRLLHFQRVSNWHFAVGEKA
jgi:2-polyprenyl-3-methyl-5-hydroxy-6-metoxy-1,4-benzoquinol methylase